MTKRAMAIVVALGIGMWIAPTSTVQSDSTIPGRGQWVPSWQIVYGGYRQVVDLAPAGPDEAWGVSTADFGSVSHPREQTAFVHWVDGSGAAEQVVNNRWLWAIAMSGPDFGLAVGRRGHVYRYDGSYWRPITSPVSNDLTDVALLAPDDGWVVGDRGTILRWDGTRLRLVDSPVHQARIVALDMVTPDQGWAVTKYGRVLMFDDGTWTEETAPEIRELTDVAFADADHGLAVGLGVLERKGGVWRTVETDARWTVSVAWDGEIAYAAADDRVVAYQDGGWTQLSYEPGPVDLSNINYRTVVNGTDGVWALERSGTTVTIENGVGRYVWPTMGSLQAIDMVPGDREFSWSGGYSIIDSMLSPQDGSWRSSSPMPVDERITSISLVSEYDGWAIGQGPEEEDPSQLWHLTEDGWSEWPVNKLWQLGSVDMLAADDGWLSGSNVIARWDGDEWLRVQDAPLEGLSGALSMLQGGESPLGWFAGVGVIHHLRGMDWQRQELPEGVTARSMDVPAEDIGWASDMADVYKYDGELWSKIELPVSDDSIVHDIDAPVPSEVWILVDPEGLLHWSPDGWELHPLSSLSSSRQPLRLQAVPYSAEEGRGVDVWLAGHAPTLARYRVVAPAVQLYLPLTRYD